MPHSENYYNKQYQKMSRLIFYSCPLIAYFKKDYDLLLYLL